MHQERTQSDSKQLARTLKQRAKTNDGERGKMVSEGLHSTLFEIIQSDNILAHPDALKAILYLMQNEPCCDTLWGNYCDQILSFHTYLFNDTATTHPAQKQTVRDIFKKAPKELETKIHLTETWYKILIDLKSRNENKETGSFTETQLGYIADQLVALAAIAEESNYIPHLPEALTLPLSKFMQTSHTCSIQTINIWMHYLLKNKRNRTPLILDTVFPQLNVIISSSLTENSLPLLIAAITACFHFANDAELSEALIAHETHKTLQSLLINARCDVVARRHAIKTIRQLASHQASHETLGTTKLLETLVNLTIQGEESFARDPVIEEQCLATLNLLTPISSPQSHCNTLIKARLIQYPQTKKAIVQHIGSPLPETQHAAICLFHSLAQSDPQYIDTFTKTQLEAIKPCLELSITQLDTIESNKNSIPLTWLMHTLIVHCKSAKKPLTEFSTATLVRAMLQSTEPQAKKALSNTVAALDSTLTGRFMATYSFLRQNPESEAETQDDKNNKRLSVSSEFHGVF